MVTEKKLQDSDHMSNCDGVECTECGASSSCVIDDCIENGGDSAVCCYCRVEGGSMEYEEACEECKEALDDR